MRHAPQRLSRLRPGVLLALMTLALPAFASPHRGPAPAEILNGARGLCLDVEGRDGRKSANVLLWDCDGGADQKWIHNARGEIVNQAQGRCLEAEGNGKRGKNVSLADCRAKPNQTWTVEGRGERFVLKNQAKGLCLDAEGRDGKRGANVLVWDCDGASDQKWSLRRPEPPRPAPPMVLLNGAKGLCLDVDGYDGRRGANAQLWECDGGIDQTWVMNARGEIVNQAQGQCLEAAEMDGARGRNVGLYDCLGQPDQLWTVVARGDRFLLKNQAQGMCLDVAGFDGKRGDNVGLWDCDGGVDQTWSWAMPPAPQPVVVVPRPMPVPPRPEPYRPEPHRPEPRPTEYRPEPRRPEPAPRAMDEDALEKIIRAMKSESFSAGQMQAFRVGVSGRHITCAQLVRAVKAVTFSTSKVDVVREVAARVVDKENREDVVSVFTFAKDKSTVRELLR